MYCTNCGYNNDDNAKFCRSCGERLTAEVTNIIPETNEAAAEFNNSAAAAVKIKNTKKIIFPIIAVILVIAIIVTACVIVVPKLKEDRINTDTYVAAFDNTVFAVMEDGTVKSTAMYSNSSYTYDLSSWKNIRSISVFGYVVGLKEDGTCVVDFGNDSYSNSESGNENNAEQCDVTSWKDIVQVCATADGILGLKSDGTLMYTGVYTDIKPDYIGEALNWTDIVQICYGCDSENYLVAVKSDGTVISTFSGANSVTDSGDEYYDFLKQCQAAVSEWKDIKRVSVYGDYYAFGITNEGKVVTTLDKYIDYDWKYKEDNEDYNESELTDLKNTFDSGMATVAGWTDIENVFVMDSTACVFVVGIKTDGTTVAATIADESNSYGESDINADVIKADEVISKLSGITGIAGGCVCQSTHYEDYHYLVNADAFLMSDGKIELFDPENRHAEFLNNEYVSCNDEYLTWSNIKTSSDDES